MDLYDGNFKLDMIESDMRTDLEEFISELPRTPGSPMLSSLPTAQMNMCESAMDSELSDDGIGWMDSSQIYNVSSDLDSINGLLVNPETALPVSVTQLSTMATISMSSALSGTVNVTLTPSKAGDVISSSECQSVTLPVQVITTTATLVSDVDNKHSQVNLTVAVPTSASVSGPRTSQANHLSLHKLVEREENDSPKPKSKQKQSAKTTIRQSSFENSYPKPAYSYSCLIAMALKNSKTGSLPVNEIYDFMTENFPYFKTAPNGWKNSVRHNLSLNKCFEKIEKPVGNGTQRKGYLWALNPAKVEKMEEELQKWGSKDPAAIRKSMANPERLELIEKGELKNTEEIKPYEMLPASPVKIKEEVVDEEEIITSDLDVKTPVDCLGSELSSNVFSAFDASVSMENTLPDLDLQKGIWENLCEDRLQFMTGDSPMNSSSPKHSASSLNADEDSLQVSSSSDMPKSFIHGNYVYACTEHSLSSDSCDSEASKEQSDADTSDRSMICDA